MGTNVYRMYVGLCRFMYVWMYVRHFGGQEGMLQGFVLMALFLYLPAFAVRVGICAVLSACADP